jgi:hypothetical protein
VLAAYWPGNQQINKTKGFPTWSGSLYPAINQSVYWLPALPVTALGAQVGTLVPENTLPLFQFILPCALVLY